MTEEQRDSLLIEMSKNVKNINNVLDEHSKELVNLREDMNKMKCELTDKIDEHSKELVNLREDMNKMKCELTEKIDEHSKELVRLRENTAKMEHELTDKIMALFDLGEVNKDKFEETDLRIKGIENTLDWHDRRLMKLEMAD